MNKPQIHFCYTNCEQFGDQTYKILLKDGRVEVGMWGCLGRCRLECIRGTYTKIFSPLMEIVEGKDQDDLIARIRQHLGLE